ncbi:DUF2934 domain-containing protein [Bradyrhizobium erythrophlei]|uniref:DUF2934 domain-containing protein n=1 Tax=Bradyrhizobium erythrophlei TaxID=1437360 RepID=UPI0035E8EBEE
MAGKMHGLTEEAIRTRAYELWKNAGEPRGKLDRLWYQAEKELLLERAHNGEASSARTARPTKTTLHARH